MGYVGCYSSDLYCDSEKHTPGDPGSSSNPGTFTGETRGECWRKARRLGWFISKKWRMDQSICGSGFALCPKCSGKKKAE